MTETTETKKSNFNSKHVKQIVNDNAALIAFVILVITAIILRGDTFLQPVNLLNIMRSNSIVGIIALGMTLVIVMGGVNLAVGSLLALAGWIAIAVFNATHSVVLALLSCMAVGIMFGAMEGVVVAKFKVPAFIATLGTMTIYRSIALFALEGGGLMVDRDYSGPYAFISNTDLFGIPLPIYYWIILSIAAYIFTSHTAIGRHIFATGSNEKAAMLSGIKVDRVRILAFALCGVMVALAAVVETSRVQAISSSASGMTYNMDAIAAVVIGGASLMGGKAKIRGTFFGVMTLGVITNLLQIMGVNSFLHGAARGLIIIAAVVLQKRLDK